MKNSVSAVVVARAFDEQDDSQLAIIARELHGARRKRHLSLEQLADLSGVSRSMISKIERSEASSPKPSTSPSRS